MFNHYSKRPGFNPLFLDDVAYTWGPLNFLNLYRLLISGLFITFYFTGNPFPQLASHNPYLFYGASGSYLIAGLLFGMMIRLRKPDFNIQIHIQILSDIIFTTLIMHASGGVQSGLGTLIIISIAGGSIVIRGRHSLLFASVASLAVLYEEYYNNLEGVYLDGSSLQAGILGITFFTTAIITHFVAKHIRESEALALERGVDLANMSQLTEHIIQRMQTGILVVDQYNRLRLINESAWHMLNMPSIVNNPYVSAINEDLNTAYTNWQNNNEVVSTPLQLSPEYPNLLPRFAQLSQEKNPATLIFLEDASAMSREAQQLQLAALGRLTASIAHEIRNPLGAISHAGQLLAESPNMDAADLRLTQIISDHSKRVNTIIENVMQLGRGNQSYPQLVELRSYLESFLNDFMSGNQTQRNDFLINMQQEDIRIHFDPSHLQQILTNLCENGIRHTTDTDMNKEQFKIEFHAGISSNNNRPYLDIIDHGTGIDEETATHIFEPFYTTAETGTGLGLYISRELAECNQAHLTLLQNEKQGSCFRLTFSDPRRQMN
ncbi:MAG: ATP-binding protein [Gammaproteobacteria bacterium]|nr:ATP-binding protein [Gammaproteobacteria bacterium]MCW8988408.1 ATP-binding protein [Gammaproteobacteria bacterium]MCW9032252.1 ATP-binding protein [Gammaproteobacteria bacterium]